MVQPRINDWLGRSSPEISVNWKGLGGGKILAFPKKSEAWKACVVFCFYEKQDISIKLFLDYSLTLLHN